MVDALVVASVLGDAWRLGLSLGLAAALVLFWYFLASHLGTF